MQGFSRAVLPVLVQLVKSVLSEDSQTDAAATMLRISAKIFYSCIFMSIPDCLIRDPALAAEWLQVLLFCGISASLRRCDYSLTMIEIRATHWQRGTFMQLLAVFSFKVDIQCRCCLQLCSAQSKLMRQCRLMGGKRVLGGSCESGCFGLLTDYWIAMAIPRLCVMRQPGTLQHSSSRSSPAAF